MKRILALFLAGITAGSALAQPVLLEKADALPLNLSDDFSFRKVKTYRHVSRSEERLGGSNNRASATVDQMISFEEKRRSFGAITRVDERQRYGNYITLFWRAERPANITVRLEYRQSNLGPYVQAQEVAYENVVGNHKTEFAVIGDDFRWDGPTTSWRALLIEDGAIVGLHSSFLWN